MPRCHGIRRSRLKKKQKISNVGKDCEESSNGNRSEHIEISVINSQGGEFEYGNNDELDFDSTSNNHPLLKNLKVGSDSYHELSQTTQRTVKCTCNRVKALIDSICHDSWQSLIIERILAEGLTKSNDNIPNPDMSLDLCGIQTQNDNCNRH
eukprot:7314739-Ditylum_brightwellii.AAC.1